MIHPDDVLLFEEVRAAMFRVAKRYDLKLADVVPESSPEHETAHLGTCGYGGLITLTMRGADDGEWAEEPRRAEDVWDTAAHELAHLRHMNHGPAFQEFELEMQDAVANQSEDHRERVIRKLVKMQAVRDGEAKLGNEQAAEAFAGAINRMMLDYELKPSDVDYARALQDDPVVEVFVEFGKHGLERKKARCAWQEELARVVAKANLTTYLIRGGSNDIWFVGTRSHALVAEYTYGFLARSADEMADREYGAYFKKCRDEGDVRRARGFRAAWLDAFVDRVGERLDLERQAAVKQAAADVPGGEAMALVRIDQALAKARKYVDDKFKKKRRYAACLNGGRDHAAGRAWGRAAADRMAIGRRGVTGSSPRGFLCASSKGEK